MRNTMASIFEEAASKAKKVDRIEVLRKAQHPAMLMMLAAALNPHVKWDLPEGEYEYKPNPIEIDQDGILYNEIRKLYLFLKPNHIWREHNPNLSPEKRKLLFVQLLEEVDAHDAKMLLAAKDKKLHVKLSRETVEEAFPGLTTFKPE